MRPRRTMGRHSGMKGAMALPMPTATSAKMPTAVEKSASVRDSRVNLMTSLYMPRHGSTKAPLNSCASSPTVSAGKRRRRGKETEGGEREMRGEFSGARVIAKQSRLRPYLLPRQTRCSRGRLGRLRRRRCRICTGARRRSEGGTVTKETGERGGRGEEKRLGRTFGTQRAPS